MVELYLLGGLDLKDPGGQSVLSVLSHPKRVAVLVFLTLDGRRVFVNRDRLLPVFWPESDESHARNCLNQILFGLRQSLGENVVVTQGGLGVGVRSDGLWCDALAFAQAYQDGDNLGALNLYVGDLLEGFHLPGAAGFDDWLDTERRRLREMAARTAWAAAHDFLVIGKVTDAERTAQRALELVCTDENEVQRFIQELARTGDRAAAFRFFERFRVLLEKELGLSPSKKTIRVIHQLMDDRSQPVGTPLRRREKTTRHPKPPYAVGPGD